MSENEVKMEGWLYVIRPNRLIGLHFSRKRYFILQDHQLKSFKSAPYNIHQDPIKTALIDSCIRVTDNGRESIHRKVFFIFTLHNTANHNDELKLGATSPEEAAGWIHSFQEAALKTCPPSGISSSSCSDNSWQSLSARLSCSRRIHYSSSIEWAMSLSSRLDPMTSDVIAPSPWTIFGCQNGLRLFKEAKDKDAQKIWDDHPAIMAVCVVDGSSEDIFQTIMSLGPSRSQWDFCFYKGNVIEHLDGHSDIIHKQLQSDWLPWGMQKRDLLLRRYWRRDEDGTYGGGYVITPANHGKQSIVKHMLAIDWKFWKAYLLPSSARSVTISMLGRIAALREFFRAKTGDFALRDIALCRGEVDGNEAEDESQSENREEKHEEKDEDKTPSEYSSLVGFNDVGDEFFDVPEQCDCDLSDDGWSSDCFEDMGFQDKRHKLSTAAGFVKKLHELAVHKKGYVDLQELVKKDRISCYYGSTLPKDPTCTVASSWTMTEPETFLIRSKSYLKDQKKIKANGTLMQMVAADWLRSDKREDDLGGRLGGIVQDYAAKGGPEFFFIVNIQVPGSTTYSLALYFMMSTPLEDVPLLQSFVNEDDAYRNSRFKLIPYISKGPWIVKQSVGKKACLVGQALQMNYFQGKNYIELGIDIGSSTVARGVVSLVLGYLNNLVIELAFLIQANTEDELPEQLVGTCRLNHLDASKALGVTCRAS